MKWLHAYIPSGHHLIRSSGHHLIRLLTLISGALLIVGALKPWAYVPLRGLRLPLYGLFGWGGLVVVAGFLLLLHPRPSRGLLLTIAAGAAYLAWSIPPRLLAGARAATGTVDSWFEPLNQLLGKFRIAGLHVTDWPLPAADFPGPGVPLTLWGAGLAAASALLLHVLQRPQYPISSRCPTCATRLAGRQGLRFCPACGVALRPEPVCPDCHSTAAPGDRHCGHCGRRLSAASDLN